MTSSCLRLLTTSPTTPTSLAALSRAVLADRPLPQLVFLVGGPGAGKGTLGQLICSRLSYAHISVGELLRSEAKLDTALGAEIRPVIENGGIVCSSVSTELLLRHLMTHRKERWIVDGFPRKLKNAVMWDELGFAPTQVVGLEVSEGEMAHRLTKRGRKDDVPEIILQRIQRHLYEWPLIRDFYKRKGLWTALDGSGEKEKVWERYLQATNQRST